MLLGKLTVICHGPSKKGFKPEDKKTDRKKTSPISTLNACLHILVAHHQTTLLIPGHQHHPLVRPRIQLVQTREDVSEVHDRVEVLVHLVEDVVSEEFDDVSVAGF